VKDLDPRVSPLHHLGAEIRHARERAGMSQADLAGITLYDRSYVSQVETGDLDPSESFVQGCDKAFPDRDGWFTRYWRDAHKWDGLYPAWLESWVGAEHDAKVIRWWEPLQVPGLLQTADYARELIMAWQAVDDPDEVDRLLAGRLDRQRIFERSGPPTLIALIDETVLYRCIGSTKIMHDQLEHLIGMTSRPNVSIHIVPANVGAHAGLLGAFAVAELNSSSARVVYLETPDQGLTSDSPGLADKILGKFEMLRSEASSKRESRDSIRREADGRWKP
jgi:transcriptional regulator with XRE-family HTH domain